MSSAELAHLFPSATHPALPVAASILSTLRALTAPGKGNDLRPEERTALVGVAALLACERVHSNDLAPSAVQRATSVAPAHFKSALARARTLLASPSLSSPASSRSSATMTPPTPSMRLDPLSPFMTPRKKFRATSARDLSGLLTPHKHSPAASSPLRTATPRKRGAEEEEEGTPSKRPRGEGETPRARDVGDPQTPSRNRRAGAAAFLALRPRQPDLRGVENGEGEGVQEKETENGEKEGNGPPLARPDLDAEIDNLLGRRIRRRLRPRRDWTFRENVWAPDREGMERILAAVDMTPKAKTKGKGKAKAADFSAQLVALLA